MSEILISAMRQYRHNDSDEFVGGYDKPIIDKQFKTMQDRIEELEGQLEELTSLKDEADSLCTIQDKQISELERQLDDLASRLDGELISVRYLDELLKHAYCGVVGADSIVGLDSCDDYSDWLKSLEG